MKYKLPFVLLAGLVAASALLSGCKDQTVPEKVFRAAKLASTAALIAAKEEDSAKVEADLDEIAGHFDRVLAYATLTDALVTELLAELVDDGKVDRRRAMLIKQTAEELWTELRPKDGVLEIGNPKVRAALQAFPAGIRAALKDWRDLAPSAIAALTSPTGGSDHRYRLEPSVWTLAPSPAKRCVHSTVARAVVTAGQRAPFFPHIHTFGGGSRQTYDAQRAHDLRARS